MKAIKSIIFYNPEKDGENRLFRRLHWCLNILAILVWSGGLGVVSLFFARGRYPSRVFFSYFSNPLIIFLNLLPVLLVALLFYFIANRMWVSIIGSGVVIFVPTVINHIKLTLRNDPILATDIHYISEAASISTGYNIVINRYIMSTIVVIVLATIFAAIFLRARIKKGRVRLIALAALIVVSAVSYVTLYRSDTIYEKTLNLDGKMSRWSDSDQYVCRGFLYPLLYSTKELSDGKPDGYNKEETEAYYNSFASGDIAEDKQINVISIMLEAFNDFSKFDAVDFTDDPYYYLHLIEEESAHGELVTNIFSGGTIDTERCYDTGSTELIEYRAPTYSLARFFKSQGYSAQFCHTGFEWFYNRQNVADYMGFDEAYFYENRYTMPDGWGAMHDWEFMPDLVTLLKEANENGEKYFNMSVTYQNHGPYSDSELEREKTYVSEDGISQEAWYILNNYFAGVAETCEDLWNLINELRDYEEPVVLVFFGDHNPWLGDNAWVYEELGINFDGDDGFYNYYCTPWVIWENDAARAITEDTYSIGDKGNFSPCFLSAELFDLLGWEGDSTINALRDLREYADVIHITGNVRENGVLTTEPSEETAEKIAAYKKIEYYLRKDAYN
jgi:hypothetical protein